MAAFSTAIMASSIEALVRLSGQIYVGGYTRLFGRQSLCRTNYSGEGMANPMQF